MNGRDKLTLRVQVCLLIGKWRPSEKISHTLASSMWGIQWLHKAQAYFGHLAAWGLNLGCVRRHINSSTVYAALHHRILLSNTDCQWVRPQANPNCSTVCTCPKRAADCKPNLRISLSFCNEAAIQLPRFKQLLMPFSSARRSLAVRQVCLL